MMVCCEGGGVEKVPVTLDKQREAVLTTDQVTRIGRLVKDLEERLGTPQDFEWAYEGGKCAYAVCVCVRLHTCTCTCTVCLV